MDGELDTLSIDQIQSLVRTVFAQAQVTAAHRFPGSHDSLNYDLQIQSPSMAITLKIYRGHTQPQSHKEAYLLQLITSETGVPVPRLLRSDDSGEWIPAPWILCTRLVGQPLIDVLDTLDQWELESLGYEMGRYLEHLHRIPLDTFGEFLMPNQAGWYDEKQYTLHQIDQYLESNAVQQGFPMRTIDTIHDIFGQTSHLVHKKACLVHGAFGPQNVIVEQGIAGYHVSGFVDFKYAIGSRPELDMAPLFNCYFDRLPTFEKGFLDGYTEAGQLDAQVWERIPLYKLFDLVKQLATTQRDLATEIRQRWQEQIATLLVP